jgi:hypothetical protein
MIGHTFLDIAVDKRNELASKTVMVDDLRSKQVRLASLDRWIKKLCTQRGQGQRLN